MKFWISNFQANLSIFGWDFSFEITFRWMSLDLTNDSQHWFRQWLGAVSQQAITWANVSSVLCHHYGVIMPQWVNSWQKILHAFILILKPKKILKRIDQLLLMMSIIPMMLNHGMYKYWHCFPFESQHGICRYQCVGFDGKADVQAFRRLSRTWEMFH